MEKIFIIAAFVFIVITLVVLDRDMSVLKKKEYHDLVIKNSTFMRGADWLFNSFFEWRRWRKILFVSLIVIVLAAAIGYIYISQALPKATAVPEITINHNDTVLLARGKYLVHHVAICVDCHSPRDPSHYSWPIVEGQEGAGGPFLSKKAGFAFPGESFTPNITPFNLGNWSDGEIYRLLTTGIRKDGTSVYHAMPFEAFAKADPEDLKAIIAYIRTLNPIQNEPLGKTEIDFVERMYSKTIPRKAEPVLLSSLKTPAEKGKYLVTMALCDDCHTPKKFGDAFDSTLAYSGRIEFPMPTGGFVHSANLTPDESGLSEWTEDAFVNRFKSFRDSSAIYKVEPNSLNSIMPWFAYRYMNDDDLRNIYAYLRTVNPVYNPVVKFTHESLKTKEKRRR